MKSLVASVRLILATMLVCVGAYTALILVFAQAVTPQTAQGSLIRDKNGRIIGSHLIAQKFTQPRYFWPRPSAVDYNAAAAGGSNKSPTSSDIADRARTNTIVQFGATAENPLPADLAATSGSGLDPHITEHAALYQVDRVAKARQLPPRQIVDLIRKSAYAPGGVLAGDRLVNVLELNVALDKRK